MHGAQLDINTFKIVLVRLKRRKLNTFKDIYRFTYVNFILSVVIKSGTLTVLSLLTLYVRRFFLCPNVKIKMI